jgi:hypothetical protein
MPLIVEDGTGLSTAESLCSVAEANLYHSNRGNAVWEDLDADVKEQLLRKATDYMQQTYRARWKGYRRTFTQRLDWPRQSVIIDDYPLDAIMLLNIVPPEVKDACAELALRANAGALMVDLDQGKASVTVGPVSVVYNNLSPQAKRFPAVDRLLTPFLMAGGGMARLERC